MYKEGETGMSDVAAARLLGLAALPTRKVGERIGTAITMSRDRDANAVIFA